MNKALGVGLVLAVILLDIKIAFNSMDNRILLSELN